MKKIILNEKQERILAEVLNEEIYQMPIDKKANKPYCVNPEKVLIVKKFLDKTFTAHDYETIGNEGMPVKIKIISMNSENGEPLKYMYKNQLHDLLIDRFQNMFFDKIERELFLKQVMEEWINGSISIFGNLSTNRIMENTMKEIDKKANEADKNPTDAQKEAGNYKMGHIRVENMNITIETPKGSKRTFKNNDGTEGYKILKNHYGYFTNTTGNGKDGDAVDVFIGPNAEQVDTVYVVDQNNTKGEFDESKVMLGFNSTKQAKDAYLSNFDSDWKGFRTITSVPMNIFKKWLYRKHKQRKPFSEYVMIKKNKLEESASNKIKEEQYKILTMPFNNLKEELIEELTERGAYAYNEGNSVCVNLEGDCIFRNQTKEKLKEYVYDFLKKHNKTDWFND